MSQPVQEGSGDAGQQSSGTSPKSATMRMGKGMGGQEALWLCLPTLPSPEKRKTLMIIILEKVVGLEDKEEKEGQKWC